MVTNPMPRRTQGGVAAVHDYELFHGIVMMKILRRVRPVTTLLVETGDSEGSSEYILNESSILLIKHSSAP